MTPERDQNLGPDNAAVAVEEDNSSQAPAEDSTPRQTAAKAGKPADARPAEPGADSTGRQDRQADFAAARTPTENGAGGDSVKKAEFQEVSATPARDQTANLELLLDVVVPVSVELGRTSLTVKDILSTCQGSVIELDRAAGEPVDIMVGGKPLARGEVVVVKDRFGVRITELIGSIESVSKA